MCEMSYTDKSTFGQYNCFYGIQQICGNGLKLDGVIAHNFDLGPFHCLAASVRKVQRDTWVI